MILRQTLKRGSAAVVACVGLAGLIFHATVILTFQISTPTSLLAEASPHPLALPTH